VWGDLSAQGNGQLRSDADLTVVDLEAEGVIDEHDLHGSNNVTPFHGRSTKGCAVATIVRGRLVMRDGELTGVQRGRVIAQNRAPVAAGIA
jgi:dihydroorotase-like cyclic amidohydrolase